jgi:hypothetical protein
MAAKIVDLQNYKSAFANVSADLDRLVDRIAEGELRRNDLEVEVILRTITNSSPFTYKALREHFDAKVKAQFAKVSGHRPGSGSAIQSPAPMLPPTGPVELPDIPSLMDRSFADAVMTTTLFVADRWHGEDAGFVCQRTEKGEVLPIRREPLRIICRNKRVDMGDGTTRRLDEYILDHPQRPGFADVVFRPGGKVGPHEFNRWTGLAIKPGTKGTNRAGYRRIWWHLCHVLCQGDRKLLAYLVKWLAHAVQFPGTAPGVVVVLMSKSEGSGKSTLNDLMAPVFGIHGAQPTPGILLERFNEELSGLVFVGLNEVHFPGDRAAADKIKDAITAPQRRIEGKNRPAWYEANYAHIVMTTNSDWAVFAGKNARRWFVLDVDEAKVKDLKYFEDLHAEMEHGGREAFLAHLLKVKVTTRDLRNPPTTHALRMQQVRSNPWAEWCLEVSSEQIMFYGDLGGSAKGFGGEVLVSRIERAFCDWAKRHKRPTLNAYQIGRKLRDAKFLGRHTAYGTAYTIPADPRDFFGAIKRAEGIR